MEKHSVKFPKKKKKKKKKHCMESQDEEIREIFLIIIIQNKAYLFQNLRATIGTGPSPYPSR